MTMEELLESVDKFALSQEEKQAAYDDGYNDGFYDGYEAASSGEIGSGRLDASDYRDKLSASDWIKLTADWSVAEEAAYAEGYKAADQSTEVQALTAEVGKMQKILWVHRGFSLLFLSLVGALIVFILRKKRKKKADRSVCI